MVSNGAGLIFKGTGFYITDYKKRDDKSKPNSSRKPVKSSAKETVASS